MVCRRSGDFDAGLVIYEERFVDLAQALADPDDQAHFSNYVSPYVRTVPDPLHGTWALLQRLKLSGIGVHANTNWSAETWPERLKLLRRLGTVCDMLVVSGQEKIIKPDGQIFEFLCARAGVMAQDCVLIDDSQHNVDVATAVGMDGILITSPQALETMLTTRRAL